MLHGFLGLRHDAVVGRDHQDHDVGRLGATGTHRGERGVAGGIQEGHHATLGFDVVGTDMLGDAAGLARGDLGATDVVEQRGLAVVDVAHDGDDRRAGDCLAFELQGLGQLFFQRVLADQLDLVAQLFGDQLGGLLVRTWLMVTGEPILNMNLTTSAPLTDIWAANSATVMVSPMFTSRTIGPVGFWNPCWLRFFSFDLPPRPPRR